MDEYAILGTQVLMGERRVQVLKICGTGGVVSTAAMQDLKRRVYIYMNMYGD